MGKRRTLPDSLERGLDLVSIGINPSRYSVERGFYFARPGNRFWPTLAASGLIPQGVAPGPQATKTLLARHRIGFTDLVKRATARAQELGEREFARGAQQLAQKLLRLQPRIAWFHGTGAYARFLRYALGVERRVAAGLQPERIGATRIFVTPNPSGANPQANPAKLLPWYRRLARLKKQSVADGARARVKRSQAAACGNAQKKRAARERLTPSAARSAARRC